MVGQLSCRSLTHDASKAQTRSLTCHSPGLELAEQGFELGQPGSRACALWGGKGRVPWLRVKWVLGRLGTQGPWAAMVGESPCNECVLNQEP